MKDPVALAYSGRIAEARVAAIEQAASEDPFLAGQGLEALAVLGQQYGLRTTAEIDAVLLRRSTDESLRRVFEAAMSVGSHVLDPPAIALLHRGKASWELLRYIGESPTPALGRALAEGWPALPPRLLDEALLTCCVMPVANRGEAEAWGARALHAVRDLAEETRLAALTALRSWRPPGAAQACAQTLEDESARARALAADLLAELDPELLRERASELGADSPEVMAALERLPRKPAARAGRRATRRD